VSTYRTLQYGTMPSGSVRSHMASNQASVMHSHCKLVRTSEQEEVSRFLVNVWKTVWGSEKLEVVSFLLWGISTLIKTT